MRMKASRPHDEAMVELLREDASFADETWPPAWKR
jgi:hypothetical protein